MLKPREAISSLIEYCPPLGARDGLRLDFNENTAGCSPRVLECLRTLDAEMLTRYPQRDSGERIAAEHLNVSRDELLLTNGTDEAIHLICHAYLQPGDEAIVVVPTFAMFEIYAAATGARVISIPAGAEFRFPTESVLAHINSRTRLIAVANPNNPTGALAPLRDLARLAKSAPQTALLVDEAYFEFCGESMIRQWREFPNIFVSRTLSKAYGLAGLRVGILMGNEDQMRVLQRATSPYNLNSVALACLPAALADREFVQDYVSHAIEGRCELEAELADWSVHYWPSRANFVLFRMGELCKPFVSDLRSRGILVRDRSSDYGCAGCVRITVGQREHNQRLFAALREVFTKLGVRVQVSQ